MQILKPGFVYSLPNAGRPDETGQVLHFIELGDDAEAIVSDGTTEEEVIKALIEKLNYRYDAVPSESYRHAINNLEDALIALRGGEPATAATPRSGSESADPAVSAPGSAEGPDIVNQPEP